MTSPPLRDDRARLSIRKAFLAAGNGPLLIATDGSSIGKSPTPTTAGWGMACCIKDNRDPKDQKVAGGPLQGMVTSPSAAEMQALLHVLRALREAPRPATTMVDNLNCVRGVSAGRYTGYRHVLWREIFNHMAHLPDVEVVWIPSHGKKQGEWRPRRATMRRSGGSSTTSRTSRPLRRLRGSGNC